MTQKCQHDEQLLDYVYGELSDAERTYRAALHETATADGAPLRGTADMHVGLAGVLLERGDFGDSFDRDGFTKQVVEVLESRA